MSAEVEDIASVSTCELISYRKKKKNYSIAPDKMVFFLKNKSIDIFLISPQRHILWHSLEEPQQGSSNEYPQHMFSWRNQKNICLCPVVQNLIFLS